VIQQKKYRIPRRYRRIVGKRIKMKNDAIIGGNACNPGEKAFKCGVNVYLLPTAA
jgi:hypothetical protein